MRHPLRRVLLSLLVVALAVAGVAPGQAAAQTAKRMYWSDQGTAKIQWANLDGSGVQDLVTTGLVNPVGIALDLAVGGLARGFQPSKAVCKNVTSKKTIMIALAPGVLSWDCTGAGLAMNAGDHLNSLAPGTLSWDCAARGLLVSPGDKLKMIITGSEP